MKNLRKILARILIGTVVCSCTTGQVKNQVNSYYRHKNQDGLKNEFEVSADRVTMLCEQIMPDEDRYGFMIFILNNENRAIAFFQSLTSDLRWCEGQKKAVQKILDTGKKIYIAGMGKFQLVESEFSESKVSFKEHGSIYHSQNSFLWMLIANENGKCFSQFHGSEPPCSGGEFPIENNPIK